MIRPRQTINRRKQSPEKVFRKSSFKTFGICLRKTPAVEILSGPWTLPKRSSIVVSNLGFSGTKNFQWVECWTGEPFCIWTSGGGIIMYFSVRVALGFMIHWYNFFKCHRIGYFIFSNRYGYFAVSVILLMYYLQWWYLVYLKFVSW